MWNNNLVGLCPAISLRRSKMTALSHAETIWRLHRSSPRSSRGRYLVSVDGDWALVSLADGLALYHRIPTIGAQGRQMVGWPDLRFHTPAEAQAWITEQNWSEIGA